MSIGALERSALSTCVLYINYGFGAKTNHFDSESFQWHRPQRKPMISFSFITISSKCSDIVTAITFSFPFSCYRTIWSSPMNVDVSTTRKTHSRTSSTKMTSRNLNQICMNVIYLMKMYCCHNNLLYCVYSIFRFVSIAIMPSSSVCTQRVSKSLYDRAHQSPKKNI